MVDPKEWFEPRPDNPYRDVENESKLSAAALDRLEEELRSALDANAREFAKRKCALCWKYDLYRGATHDPLCMACEGTGFRELYPHP